MKQAWKLETLHYSGVTDEINRQGVLYILPLFGATGHGTFAILERKDWLRLSRSVARCDRISLVEFVLRTVSQSSRLRTSNFNCHLLSIPVLVECTHQLLFPPRCRALLELPTLTVHKAR